MTSARTRKPPARKKQAVRKKKKAPRFVERIPVARIVLVLAVAFFLFVSVVAAGYVIFFRVVVADQTGYRLERSSPVSAAEGPIRQRETVAKNKFSALKRSAAASGNRQNGVA